MTELMGWKWLDYNTLASTNDTAREKSFDFDGNPLVISAIHQTKGRGRRGRDWVSDEGNLFFSYLFKTNIPISDLVFMASLSVAETILEIAPQSEITIKWPNDVLLEGKKICGILLESGENETIIVGIGVNLQKAPSADKVIYPTASLNDFKIDISREKFLQIYLQRFNLWLDIRMKQGFLPIRTAWLQKAAFLHQKINVHYAEKSLSGLFMGIDEQGYLLLKQEENVIRIAAGDVFI